ncbi:MAG: HAMP domain-containing histidine kinase [Candidatus Rokubacteria bacterium]|nr:HAMP domain-containing histidine kinase [Candidatus Rokubacteria bacterium]
MSARAGDPMRIETQVDVMTTILDAVGVGVYVADLTTYEILFVNAFLRSRFGASWPGRRCYDYLQAGQAGPCAFCSNGRLVRDGIAQPPYVWEFQNTVDQRWYLCIDRAIPWVDGRLVRLEVAVDITERKELERFREQYVGLVSHDLRNPLGTILTTAELLAREAADRDTEILASRVHRNAERMKLMLDDLLESVRLESPDLRLERTEVDLVALARNLVELLPPADRARIELHLPSRPMHVVGDPQRFERVIDNLLSNALKYGPAATPCVVRIGDAGGEVAVSVSDGGAPIPAEHHARLFDRFYRVPGGPGTGLGLGLFIARLIVERHGGRIGVESRAGRGNSFIVTLPRHGASHHAAGGVLGEPRLA